MRDKLVFSLLLTMFFVGPAEAQGLFGLGKKKNEAPPPASPPTSLFPTPADSPALESSSPTSEEGIEIFRGGQPQPVEETSYLIVDGEKVDNNIQNRLFGRFKKRKNDNAAPPASSSSQQAVTDDIPQFDVPAVPAPASPVVQDPAPTAAPVAISPPKPDRERRFGLPKIPLFNRDNNPPPAITPDTEVLVNNDGVLVKPGQDSQDFEYPATQQATGSPANSSSQSAPQVVNGSIVYNSWGDINYEKASAADRIVKEMKNQEAAYNQKVAEARRQMEEQVRKAQEEARIQSMLQQPQIPNSSRARQF